jgi:hypothetical protein
VCVFVCKLASRLCLAGGWCSASFGWLDFLGDSCRVAPKHFILESNSQGGKFDIQGGTVAIQDPALFDLNIFNVLL